MGVDGTSIALTCLNFYEEAINVNLPDGEPAYSYGNHIILDNAPIRRYRARKVLGDGWMA